MKVNEKDFYSFYVLCHVYTCCYVLCHVYTYCAGPVERSQSQSLAILHFFFFEGGLGTGLMP